MTYLLRLSACLFLCVSLNSFGATLYYTTSMSQIKAIDLLDNTTSTIANASVYSGLAYGEGKLFYTTALSQIKAIDLLDNTTSTIANASVYSGLAYQPSPVPLPAGIYFFLSGLVGLVGVKLRGRNG